MTVVPVNVESIKKAETAESKARWKTEKGWIFPGMKSTLECNEHPQRPNTARIEELQEVRLMANFTIAVHSKFIGKIF
jgi:hypothetical protein